MHVSVGSTPMACFPGLELMFVNISSISRIIWSTMCKLVEPKVLLNLNKTLFSGFHVKRWSEYLQFQVNYTSIFFQILCWKNNFAVVSPQILFWVLNFTKWHIFPWQPKPAHVMILWFFWNIFLHVGRCRHMLNSLYFIHATPHA